MEQLKDVLALIETAITGGKTVTITMDDLTVGADETVVNNLSITIE